MKQAIFVPTHCGKEYNSIDGLNSHICFKHKKTGKHCDTCKKDFKDTYALNRHMKKHSDEREVCTKCYGNFKDIKSYMVSCKAKKSKKYKCDHCDKMFSVKRYVLIHTKKGSTLTQRGLLVIAEKHTLIHTVYRLNRHTESCQDKVSQSKSDKETCS